MGFLENLAKDYIEDITEDLLGSFHFLLEVEGVNHGERKVVAGFNSVAGGGVKVEKRDTTHGNDQFKTHAPGAIEFENITLSRGLTQNRDLLEWMNNILDGKMDRRSGSIILLNQDGTEVRRFEFFDAYPCSWAGPELNSEQSAVSIEKFELAVAQTRWT